MATIIPITPKTKDTQNLVHAKRPISVRFAGGGDSSANAGLNDHVSRDRIKVVFQSLSTNLV